MKIIRVLGSERMYLMDDGTKRPFGYNATVIKDKPIKTIIIDKDSEVIELKTKKTRKRKKKEL